MLEEPTRLPIGALTMTSTATGGETALNKMPEEVAAALHSALQVVALRLLASVIEAGERHPQPGIK